MSKRDRRRDRQRKEQERQLHADVVYTELPEMTFPELLDNAIWHYNEDVKRPEQMPVDDQTDRDTLHRLCVNYARHILCPGYDASYNRSIRHLSWAEAKETAKKTALAQIAMKWPELADECLRQIGEL